MSGCVALRCPHLYLLRNPSEGEGGAASDFPSFLSDCRREFGQKCHYCCLSPVHNVIPV
uniref:Uncharacterized protein n=1 Tax=Anguilla anguilla TaxID=7936 RepID=A0A0E9RIM9_ANGAN